MQENINLQDRMIRLPDVLKIVGVGKTTWYKLVKENKAPVGKQISDNIRAWSELECRAWVASRPDAAAAAAGQQPAQQLVRAA